MSSLSRRPPPASTSRWPCGAPHTKPRAEPCASTSRACVAQRGEQVESSSGPAPRTGHTVRSVKTIDDAPYLDMFSEDFLADPIATLSELRQQSWVVRTPIGGLVIGRAQVQALLADRRLRSSIPEIVRMQGVTDGPLFEALTTSILALEGDDHTRIRKLVSRAFTPRAIDVHRQDMRDTLRRLVEPVVDAGRCDFMADIAEHYPIEVMCHLLGVPDEDHEDFARWNRAITWALSF